MEKKDTSSTYRVVMGNLKSLLLDGAYNDFRYRYSLMCWEDYIEEFPGTSGYIIS